MFNLSDFDLIVKISFDCEAFILTRSNNSPSVEEKEYLAQIKALREKAINLQLDFKIKTCPSCLDKNLVLCTDFVGVKFWLCQSCGYEESLKNGKH